MGGDRAWTREEGIILTRKNKLVDTVIQENQPLSEISINSIVTMGAQSRGLD